MCLIPASSSASEQTGHGLAFRNSLWLWPPSLATTIVSHSVLHLMSAAISACRYIFCFLPTLLAYCACLGCVLVSRLTAEHTTLFLFSSIAPTCLREGEDLATSIARSSVGRLIIVISVVVFDYTWCWWVTLWYPVMCTGIDGLSGVSWGAIFFEVTPILSQ